MNCVKVYGIMFELEKVCTFFPRAISTMFLKLCFLWLKVFFTRSFDDIKNPYLHIGFLFTNFFIMSNYIHYKYNYVEKFTKKR